MEIETLDRLKRYTYWKNAEIPIVIGVSAHRKIEKKYTKLLENKVSEVIEYFLKNYPHSPIIMLNGMAQGGDLLCANVAKKKFEEGKPVRICMVIPDKEEDYLSGTSNGCPDFLPEDLEQYKEIKNFKTKNGRLVIDEIPFVAPDMEKTDEPTRQYKFRQQAIYVATKCHVLLALWDGKGAKGSDGNGIKKTDCGTPAAVDFALRHNYVQPYGTEFYSAYDGVVIKILSPREGNLDKNAGNCTYLTSENPEVEYNKIPKKLDEVLLKTDLFNKNYHKYCKKQRRSLRKKESSGKNIDNLIIPKDSKFLIGKEEYDKGGDKLRRIHDCSRIASELAAENKKIFNRFLSVLAAFGFLLLFGFMLYDQLNLLWTVVLFLVLLIMFIVGFFIIKLIDSQLIISWFKLKGKPCGIHVKAIEYRALSETLRVQYYLSACGIYYNVGNYFTWAHKNEIVWIKKAVTALFVGRDFDLWEAKSLKQKYLLLAVDENFRREQIIKINEAEGQKSACLDKIFTKWVGKDERKVKKPEDNSDKKNNNGQLGYHLENKNILSNKLKKWRVGSGIISCIAIVAYFALFILELLIRLHRITGVNLDTEIFWVINGRILFKIVLCLMSALAFGISYYYGKLALKRKINDSGNMINLFSIAINRAKAIFDNDLLYDTPQSKEKAFNSLLKGLAQEQITENGVWISYSRDSSIDLPL